MMSLSRGSACAPTNANRQLALALNVCLEITLFAGSLLLAPTNASAESLTYNFGGEITSIDAPVPGIGPLQLGVPFSGSFTYSSTSATNINSSNDFNQYLEFFPDSQLTISVAGLTIETKGAMVVSIFSGGRDPN